MTNRFDVISAFIDDEPFDALELGQALADREGREMLMDLLALGRLVQPDRSATPTITVRRRRPLVAFALAGAAAVVALVGGYQLGARETSMSDAPPAPTITIRPEGGWQPVNEGRRP